LQLAALLACQDGGGESLNYDVYDSRQHSHVGWLPLGHQQLLDDWQENYTHSQRPWRLERGEALEKVTEQSCVIELSRETAMHGISGSLKATPLFPKRPHPL
jgi:hypothetical protein